MKEIIIDGVNWTKVANANYIQKRFLKKLIRKYGNYYRLAKVARRPKQYFYRLIHKEIKPGQDLCWYPIAKELQKMSKIKGLAAGLCPKAKKENKI